jgi:hypothetical protein
MLTGLKRFQFLLVEAFLHLGHIALVLEQLLVADLLVEHLFVRGLTVSLVLFQRLVDLLPKVRVLHRRVPLHLAFRQESHFCRLSAFLSECFLHLLDIDLQSSFFVSYRFIFLPQRR